MPIRKKHTGVIVSLLILFLQINFHISAQSTSSNQLHLKPVPDVTFGKTTQWDDYFYDMYASICTGPNGNVFVSCNRQNCIYKFSPNGEFVKKFGQNGTGPGDLYSPGRLSVLDSKYLVVNEYGTLRRISLFDLDGRFEKIIKLKRNCFAAVALKNNRVAYCTSNPVPPKSKQSNIDIIIVDLGTGQETIVKNVTIPELSNFKAPNGFTITFPSQTGLVYIDRAGDGNLMVGVSNTPDIEIFSLEGKRIRSFKTRFTPVAVTKEYIAEVKEAYLARNATRRELDAAYYLTIMKKADFSVGFLDKLPYYRNFSVDTDGKVYVGKWDACANDCSVIFDVFDLDGNLQQTLDLTSADYNIINTDSQKISFCDGYLIAYVGMKNQDDENPRLIKIKL